MNAAVAGKASPRTRATPLPSQPVTPKASAAAPSAPPPAPGRTAGSSPAPAPAPLAARYSEPEFEVGQGQAPRPKSKGPAKFAAFYQQLAGLEVDGWAVWKNGPKIGSKYKCRVRTIARRLGLQLEAYLDGDGRIIVRRLPDPPPASPTP